MVTGRGPGVSSWWRKPAADHPACRDLVPDLFQGQVLLEIIFAWPGLGREMVTALNDLDYPVAQATLYLMALVILAMNFIADLLYGIIDPRVTYG